MNNDEVKATAGGAFSFPGNITINGSMFDIHDNEKVENHYHFGRGDESEQVLRTLKRDIAALAAKGKVGRDLITPYVAAFELGLVPPMTVEEFNEEFGVSINKNTATTWLYSYTKPGNAEGGREYDERELRYWLRKYGGR